MNKACCSWAATSAAMSARLPTSSWTASRSAASRICTAHSPATCRTRSSHSDPACMTNPESRLLHPRQQHATGNEQDHDRNDGQAGAAGCRGADANQDRPDDGGELAHHVVDAEVLAGLALW